MKRIIITTTLIISALSLNIRLQAQDYKTLIKQNPSRAANIYYHYHPMDSVYSLPPKGYEPFYISHYGRHGSRYHTSDKYINNALQTLKSKQNNLSPQGQQALKAVELLYNAHQGMLGQLTPRGAKEHRDIAHRMYKNFKKVFQNNNRQQVMCVSSIVPRCLISMANFTTQLKEDVPQINLDFTTGDRYMKYICDDSFYKKHSKQAYAIEDSLRNAKCQYDKLFKTLFKDPSKAKKDIKNPLTFANELYFCGSICQDVDFLNINIFNLFDVEELAALAECNNARFYGMMGNSKEFGHESSNAADSLVKDFVIKADLALNNNSNKAADLRFGHDTGILPFLNNLKIQGMETQYPMAEAHKHWMAFNMVPMGTNFQMVFYKNKNNDILVKMLYNEKEVTIPEIKPYIGKYYKWQDLRSYLVSLYN